MAKDANALFSSFSWSEQMKHTSPDIENLKEDYYNIIGCSTSLLDAIKERDKKIKELELRLEEIGRV